MLSKLRQNSVVILGVVIVIVLLIVLLRMEQDLATSLQVGLLVIVITLLVDIAYVKNNSRTVNGLNDKYLSPARTVYLVLINLVFTVLLSGLLICLILKTSDSPTESPTSSQLATSLESTLFTILVAGALGGTLCNLRGLFKQFDRNEGQFPVRLEIPFYIRPFTGAVTGLFTFFVGNLLVSSLSIEASSQKWMSLSGRLPYIGVAILAGFAAQEFMERMKETAKTLFSEREQGEALSELERLAALKRDDLLTDEEFNAKKAELLPKIGS